MIVTVSSSWDRNVSDFFTDALGNAFLWRSPLQSPSESAELAQQHSAQQRVRNLIRARDTVFVTSESNSSGDIFTLSTLLKNVEISLIIIFLPNLTIELRAFLLVVTFARDDPTRLVLHGTSDVDRTLLLLELLHCLLEDSSASSHCSLDCCEGLALHQLLVQWV